eukprot:8292444-Alexandrium_andersonii.AAC.1
MEALRTGAGRFDFLQKVDDRLREDVQKGGQPWEEDGPDRVFEYLETVLVEEGEKLFLRPPVAREEQREGSRRRRELLEERCRLRERRGVMEGDGVLEEVQRELDRLSRQLKKDRRE